MVDLPLDNMARDADMADRLYASVLSAYRRRSPLRKLLVALSGGGDSVALSHALLRLSAQEGFELTALHVNHGLRKASEAEQQWVMNLCEGWALPCLVSHINVDKQGSLEAAAHRARYDAFDKALFDTGADAIALAHHADDQLESVLLHLFHGAGPGGLGGLWEQRGPYWRPMLEVSRDMVMAYLRHHGLGHVEDESNADPRHRRNALRQGLVPAVKAACPQVLDRVRSLTVIAQEEEAYWSGVVADYLSQHAGDWPGPSLRVSHLMNQPIAFQRRVLRGFCEGQGFVLSFEQTERLRSLLDDKHGNACNLPQNRKMHKGKASLFLLPFEQPVALYPDEWLVLTHHQSATGDGLLCQVVPQALMSKAQLRPARPTDVIQAFGHGSAKPFSKFLSDKKVDLPLRPYWPVLAVGDEVLWAIGLGASEKLRLPKDHDKGVLLRYIGPMPGAPGLMEGIKTRC